MKIELTDRDVEELSSELESAKKLRKNFLIKGSLILIAFLLLYLFIGDSLSIVVVLILGLWLLTEWYYRQSKNVKKLAADLANNEKINLIVPITEVQKAKHKVYLENNLCCDLYEFESSLSKVEEGIIVDIEFLPISMSILKIREKSITSANNT